VFFVAYTIHAAKTAQGGPNPTTPIGVAADIHLPFSSDMNHDA